MLLGDIFGYMATAIGLITFTPQVIRAYKTKETKDLSLTTYIFLTIACILWLVYGLINKAGPVILANTVIGIQSLALVALKLKYH